MTDSGFNVSVRDVYDEVKALSAQLNEYLRKQEPAIAVIEQRLGEAESDIKEMRDKNEDTKKTKTVLQWQMIGVFIGASLASVLPLVLK